MIYSGGPKVELTRADLAHLSTSTTTRSPPSTRASGSSSTDSSRSVSPRAPLAVLSDHGEEFLEHGEIKHCHGLWDAEIRVPLAIRVPGRRRGEARRQPRRSPSCPLSSRRSGSIASAYDLEARSLLAEVAGGRRGDERARRSACRDRRPATSWSTTWRREAWRSSTCGPTPGSATTWRRCEPSSVAALREPLFTWLKQVEGAITSQHSLDTARETERQLRALGYLSGTTSEAH